jgi:hypothetical protein
MELHGSNGKDDAFLSKFNPEGDLLWVLTWGGADYDYARGVAVDDYGNVYVTGGFTNTTDFDPGPGLVERTSLGSFDSFLSKFDAYGNLKWVQTWGGEGSCSAHNIATDLTGNIYIAGIFYKTVDFDPGPGKEEHTPGVIYANYMSRFASTGEFEWVRAWCDYSYFDVNDIASDVDGNVYITGNFNDTTDFDPGPGIDERSAYGCNDAFLNKLDADGNHQWAETWGEEGLDYGYTVCADHYGNIYATSVLNGRYEHSGQEHGMVIWPTGDGDVFLTKFDPEGHLIWDIPLIEGDYNRGTGADVDEFGNIYISGYFGDTVDFDPGHAVDYHTSNGYRDIFLIKLDSDGVFQWVRTWGGERNEYCRGVTVGSSGDAHIIGNFYTTVDFDCGPGVDEQTPVGSSAIFLMKVLPDGTW